MKTETEQIEASKRFIATERRLLESLELAHLKEVDDYNKRKRSLLQNIEKEERQLERRSEWSL